MTRREIRADLMAKAADFIDALLDYIPAGAEPTLFDALPELPGPGPVTVAEIPAGKPRKHRVLLHGKRRYTAEDNALLAALLKRGSMSRGEVAAVLGKTEKAVYHQARALGLGGQFAALKIHANG